MATKDRSRWSPEVKAAVEAILDSGKPPQSKMDSIYDLLVRAEGLFAKAYYGERKTPAQSKRLSYLHKYAVSRVVALEAKYAEQEGRDPDYAPELEEIGMKLDNDPESLTPAESEFIEALGLATEADREEAAL